MIPLSCAVSSGFAWSKLPHSQGYELKRNSEIVGSLHKPSIWSSSFLAETQNGHWTFRRGGYLGVDAQVLDSVSRQQIATFKAAWGGRGTLTFSDGQTFHLECKGWWHPVWSVIGHDGQPVLHVHTRERTVDVPVGVSVPESRLSLLIMFAWYRVLQAEEDAASVAVIAAS